MEKVTLCIVLGLIAAVYAEPEPLGKTQLFSPISQEQIEAFKEELEEENKDGSVTCDNYHTICDAAESTKDPNSVCRITLHAWHCEQLQDVDGVREIIARIEKHHPEAINTKAGKDLELPPEEEEAGIEDEDEDEDVNGDQYEEEEANGAEEDYDDSGEDPHEFDE